MPTLTFEKNSTQFQLQNGTFNKSEKTFFPGLKDPEFTNEGSVKEAVSHNVLRLLRTVFNAGTTTFKVEREMCISGTQGFQADFCLLNSEGEICLIMECKPRDYFMELDYNKSSSKALKQALKTCANPSDRIKNPACVLGYIPKTAVADDTCNFKRAMKQLAAYMLSLNNQKAFGILTTYCHTYFAILEHPEKGRPTLKVSRAVRYSEDNVLERVFKFLGLAVGTPIVKMKDKNNSTNVSPVQIDKRKAGQRQTRASFKKGDGTKRLKGNENSKNGNSGNSGSSPKKRVTYGDYVIDGIVGKGRSGCVLRLVVRNSCSFAAKTIGKLKYKTKMKRKEITAELQNEIAIYEALKDLQGRVLPRLHFEAYLDCTVQGIL
ncbi:uncharacterized protein [Centruroides vittatus]|uniref:uncharacterized protein n=1 Tax=Centruroides vittatus TaxID=120091 RepID=UPI00351019F3